MTLGEALAAGILGTLLCLCVLQAGVWIGRARERARWVEAPFKRDPVEVGGVGFYVVHPSDMLAYKRAMRFMQSDRPRGASEALYKARFVQVGDRIVKDNHNHVDALTAIKT